MSNIFTKMKDYIDKPNRNTFDLSFQNNLTMEFGKLYPVFCKEVVPGDSMRIKPTFGLRFMPLVFPVQTRMQANLHFFYVRNRNLWKDWPDFIGRTKSNLVLPFLSPNVAKKVCKTRGLGDYLGLPTTLAGEYGNDVVEYGKQFGIEVVPNVYYRCYRQQYPNTTSLVNTPLSVWVSRSEPTYDYAQAALNTAIISDPITGRIESTIELTYRKAGTRTVGDPEVSTVGDVVTMAGDDPILSDINNSGKKCRNLRVCFLIEDDGDYKPVVEFNFMALFSGQSESNEEYSLDLDSYGDGILGHVQNVTKSTTYGSLLPDDLNVSGPGAFNNLMDWLVQNGIRYRILFGSEGLDTCQDSNLALYNSTMFAPNTALAMPEDGVIATNGYFGITTFKYHRPQEDVRDLSDVPDFQNPYASGDIKVSALPFRAYESIYNAFYRNQFNDPFVLNGVKEFNKFITTDEGGEDSTDYDLLHRNYEQDFLTSAKQSPVDGDITPLVGVSGTGTFTFQNADGTQVNITPQFAEDGTTIIGLQTVEGTPENTSSIRRLMDMASVGISINDFRNVNALQRWLETNLRRGYRYKDQLLSHFGVEAKFDVLDMPEFIGGMSEPVMVNQINQSVDQTGNPTGMGSFEKVLGSFAGQASVLAQSRHDVEKYCDEHGFIIGILSITPVPNYSQLLPKFFLKDNVLDYYFPEFGHIGNQPIPYSEVCPLQSYAAASAGGTEKLTDVFGYQRAWYDYLASVDEVHGDFRTSLDGFLINRIFNVRPELGKDFLQVSPDDMSNPFSVTDETDKILGQLYFEVTAQRPIPKFGIPRLE